MKFNQIFIALFSAFLLSSPQIMVGSELAEELEDSLSSFEKEEGGLAGISDEEADDLAYQMHQLEGENAEAYDKLMTKYGEKLEKNAAFTKTFATEDEQLLSK